MDKHVSIQGEALGGFGVQSKTSWYPPSLPTQWLDLEGACGIEKIEKSIDPLVGVYPKTRRVIGFTLSPYPLSLLSPFPGRC